MLRASCHCGAIVLRIPRRPRQLTQCNCSICRRYGALWAYYQRRFVEVEGASRGLQAYRHGPEALRFFRCRRCGCVTHHQRTRPRSDGTDRVGVNLRNIDDPHAIRELPIRLLDGARTWKTLERLVQPCLLCASDGDARPSMGTHQ